MALDIHDIPVLSVNKTVNWRNTKQAVTKKISIPQSASQRPMQGNCWRRYLQAVDLGHASCVMYGTEYCCTPRPRTPVVSLDGYLGGITWARRAARSLRIASISSLVFRSCALVLSSSAMTAFFAAASDFKAAWRPPIDVSSLPTRLPADQAALLAAATAHAGAGAFGSAEIFARVPRRGETNEGPEKAATAATSVSSDSMEETEPRSSSASSP
mmetsp:Transcript_33404/g.56242  ORF Transcript_33404/g.56242 Transcript_33404/m.56242 type:complete len:214 (-) Transcript_33404:357-998(-)